VFGVSDDFKGVYRAWPSGLPGIQPILRRTGSNPEEATLKASPSGVQTPSVEESGDIIRSKPGVKTPGYACINRKIIFLSHLKFIRLEVKLMSDREGFTPHDHTQVQHRARMFCIPFRGNTIAEVRSPRASPLKIDHKFASLH
jgi:hypothetical protein